MTVPFTKTSLIKIEELLKAGGYKVRYEKGNFKTGACVIQDFKIVIINRFSDLEAKIQSLVQIVKEIPLDLSALDAKQKTFYILITQTKLSI